MKVRYNANFQEKQKGPAGVMQRVNWRIEHLGKTYHIPVVYRFPKGLVFDVITILDEEKMRAFTDRYESCENRLTPMERRCAEQEHPGQPLPIQAILINGRRVEGGYSASCVISIPWLRQEDQVKPLRKAYTSLLKDASCFACERFCVPYPAAESKFRNWLRFFRLEKIRSMTLSTRPVHRFHPVDLSFELSAGEAQKEVSFVHPQTGFKHTLSLQAWEPVVIPHPGLDQTLYFAQARYEIMPSLPAGQYLQFNSSFHYTEKPKNRLSPSKTSAAAIGIIGGSCGPTAIIGPAGAGEAPVGSHGLPLHHCFSVPSFTQEEPWRFVLEGIQSLMAESREYKLG